MKSRVFFIDFRAGFKENFVQKLGRLLDTAGISTKVKKRDLVAVKIHFGELGNTAYIRPVYVGKVIDIIREIGGNPFLTDANTLYAGTRSDAPTHLGTALRNGFSYPVVRAPLIIADGLRGRSEVKVGINGKRFKDVYIGSEIVEADSLISLAHFKGHELSGFGGAIKNLGMGCASRRGKMAQHSGLSPKVKRKKCVGCGDCVSHCSQEAISIVEDKATIDPEKCIGCGECILICPNRAIQIRWNQSIPVFLENMIEYTSGALAGKKGRSLFVNFINDVSPACDCHGHNDSPIVRNIGVVASDDPVAIDQASVDLVNGEMALPETGIDKNRGAGKDKFAGLYPDIDWRHQLEYAMEMGLGNREYELVRI